MATGMHMDERSVDCLVLGYHDQDRKVSAKSVTMSDTTFKWLQRIALNMRRQCWNYVSDRSR